MSTKITDLRTPSEKKTFGMLKMGDFFFEQDSPQILCIKTFVEDEDDEVEEDADEINDQSNIVIGAFRFASLHCPHSPLPLSDKTVVIPVEVEIIIKENK